MGNKMVAVMTAVLATMFATTVFAQQQKQCNSISGAEDLWRFNRHSEAISCLDDVLKAEPTNVKAYFTEGKYCLSLGNQACAKQNFDPQPVREKYGKEIAGFYKQLGDSNVTGNTSAAESFYMEMLSYDSSLNHGTAVELFERGKQTATEKEKDVLFHMAAKLDTTLRPSITSYYLNQSKSAPTKEGKVDMKGKAVAYDNSLKSEYENENQALGRFHLEEAKVWATKVGKDKVTQDHKIEARKRLGDAVVDAELPDVYILTPEGFKNDTGEKGVYVFEIKKGEKTPYRINGEHGRVTDFEYYSTNHQFEIRYEKHLPVKVWAGEKPSERIDEDRILVAKENTTVIIKVIKK